MSGKHTLTIVGLSDALEKLPSQYKVKRLDEARIGIRGSLLVVAHKDLPALFYKSGMWSELTPIVEVIA